jgi:type IV secretory pathway VirB4 component
MLFKPKEKIYTNVKQLVKTPRKKNSDLNVFLNILADALNVSLALDWRPNVS